MKTLISGFGMMGQKIYHALKNDDDFDFKNVVE